ncbi:hypothetical protein OA88_22920 [Flavobacterium sp. JRM]|nr:hypothetical protein OA88_22920 [Flavobacterium sp. JRM]
MLLWLWPALWPLITDPAALVMTRTSTRFRKETESGIVLVVLQDNMQRLFALTLDHLQFVNLVLREGLAGYQMGTANAQHVKLNVPLARCLPNNVLMFQTQSAVAMTRVIMTGTETVKKWTMHLEC